MDPFDVLVQSNKHPTAVIANDGTSALAGTTSKYAVRVLSNGRAKRLRLLDGQPFVDLESGEKFTLELENNSPLKADLPYHLMGSTLFVTRNCCGRMACLAIAVGYSERERKRYLVGILTTAPLRSSSRQIMRRASFVKWGCLKHPSANHRCSFGRRGMLNPVLLKTRTLNWTRLNSQMATSSFGQVLSTRPRFILVGGDEVRQNVKEVRGNHVGRFAQLFQSGTVIRSLNEI